MANNQNEFAEFVVGLVQDHWQHEQRAYQLTELGAVIAREKPGYKHIIDMKLRPYVQCVMKDRIRFIEHPQKPVVYGVIPIEVELPANTADLFTRPLQKTVFAREFWNAFARPLFAGRRLVELSKSDNEIVSFGVRDLSDDEEIPADSYEIRPDQTVDSKVPPSPERSRMVYRNIEAWLEATELDSAIFRGQSTYQKGVSGSDQMRDFARLLGSIERADQERIHIPLDIVIKLLSRR